jgi:hypothetical protein
MASAQTRLCVQLVAESGMCLHSKNIDCAIQLTVNTLAWCLHFLLYNQQFAHTKCVRIYIYIYMAPSPTCFGGRPPSSGKNTAETFRREDCNIICTLYFVQGYCIDMYIRLSVISGFRRDVFEICALLGQLRSQQQVMFDNTDTGT